MGHQERHLLELGETGTPPKAGDILFLSPKGDGTTIQHTGIVIGMDGDKVVYAAGNDGSNFGFNKHTANLANMREGGDLVALGDPFTKKAAGGNTSGSHETPPLDPNMLEGFMASVLQQESGANWGTPPNSATASGGFQITKSLWNGYDGYAAAYQAPPEVQRKFAKDSFTQYYKDYYANRDMDSMSGEFNAWHYLAIAWYAGPNALTPQYLATHSLTRRQGPNGEYPSIVQYAHQVVDGTNGSTHPGMMHYVKGTAQPPAYIPGLRQSDCRPAS